MLLLFVSLSLSLCRYTVTASVKGKSLSTEMRLRVRPCEGGEWYYVEAGHGNGRLQVTTHANSTVFSGGVGYGALVPLCVKDALFTEAETETETETDVVVRYECGAVGGCVFALHSQRDQLSPEFVPYLATAERLFWLPLPPPPPLAVRSLGTSGDVVKGLALPTLFVACEGRYAAVRVAGVDDEAAVVHWDRFDNTLTGTVTRDVVTATLEVTTSASAAGDNDNAVVELPIRLFTVGE